MNDLIAAFKQMTEEELTFEKLGDFVYQYDFSKLQYADLLPTIENQNDYARNILLMDPLEVVLLHWPVGVESAIHFHEGFYGYVVILEGKGGDFVYKHEGQEVWESRISYCSPLGIIAEPDGVIHKIVNSSTTDKLVTLHIYYPPLESFEGMNIYDLEKGRIGELSATAATASWSDDQTMFNKVSENAFEFKHHDDIYPDATHRIVMVCPKPKPDEIRENIIRYFNEQATEYDAFDEAHLKRKQYNATIDRLIGEDIHQSQEAIKKKLVLACGTGRRALAQMEFSQSNIDILGIDMSPEMAEMAREKGINVICAPWLAAPIPKEDKFDMATFLYAFGHIPNHNLRLETLRKINRHLNMGGILFMDLFHLHTNDEWGPKIEMLYKKHQLHRAGYEEGDVFYQKSGGQQIAYLHYFTEPEIKSLLNEAGFNIQFVKYIGYSKNAGEVMEQPENGFLFIKAQKTQEVH